MYNLKQIKEVLIAMVSNIEESEIYFVKDYIKFGLYLRKTMFNALYDKYLISNNEAEKELCFLNSYFIIGTSYEDISILCLSLSEYYCNKRTYLLERLLNYKPGEAILSNIISGKTKKEIFQLLGLGLNKYEALGFTKYESKRLIEGIIKNIKIIADEQDIRIKIYNKLKHGGIVMSSNDITGKKQGPRILLEFNKSTSKIIRTIIPNNEGEMEKCRNQIESNLRIIGELLIIYLINKYQNEIDKYFPEKEFNILRDAINKS
jgi:hypothetical protein